MFWLLMTIELTDMVARLVFAYLASFIKCLLLIWTVNMRKNVNNFADG
jgi:hypothetical protein